MGLILSACYSPYGSCVSKPNYITDILDMYLLRPGFSKFQAGDVII